MYIWLIVTLYIKCMCWLTVIFGTSSCTKTAEKFETAPPPFKKSCIRLCAMYVYLLRANTTTIGLCILLALTILWLKIWINENVDQIFIKLINIGIGLCLKKCHLFTDYFSSGTTSDSNSSWQKKTESCLTGTFNFNFKWFYKKRGPAKTISEHVIRVRI